MELNYIHHVLTYFKNLALNSVGASRDIYQHLMDNDVDYVIEMMDNSDEEVDKAIQEYNPQLHKVMHRKDKYLDSGDIYKVEKLPRTRARYINEVELFFLLGNPIIWRKRKGSDEAYHLFMDFIEEMDFNSTIRQAKRLAGSETESAKLYHIYNEKGEIRVRPVVLARSLGYRLRPLFDQYRRMLAFAYGYYLRENGSSVLHWDIQTPEMLFFCTKKHMGWEVEKYENPTGKINVLYYRQLKAWDGVQGRIDREEDLDSKEGDNNNYFADPIAIATADVIDSMVDPNRPGKLIQLSGNNSRFDYVNPPQASVGREQERRNLRESILFDTFTPDFSYENLKGMGSLSGAAIKNAMVLGFIKRANRMELYERMLRREEAIIIAILKLLHPDKQNLLDELDMKPEFAEPFAIDENSKWGAVENLYKAGLISIEEAVKRLALTECPDEEVDKIKLAMMESTMAQEEEGGQNADN